MIRRLWPHNRRTRHRKVRVHGLRFGRNDLDRLLIEARLRFGRNEQVIVQIAGLRLAKAQIAQQLVRCLRVHVAQQRVQVSGLHGRIVERPQFGLRFDVAQAHIEIVHREVLQAAVVLAEIQIVQIAVGVDGIVQRIAGLFVDQLEAFVLVVGARVNR